MKDRYYLLDAMRGFSMISMVAFHFCYDIFMVYGVDTSWYHKSWAHIWQQSICWGFILISGYVWKWSRSPLKRGLIVSGFGILISAVTNVLMPSEGIWWGILSFIGAAMILTIPVDRGFSKKKNSGSLALVSFIIFLCTMEVSHGILGISGISLRLPDYLYRSVLGIPFGFIPPGFRSADFFPLFPWYFLYLTGFFIGRIELIDSVKEIFKVKIPFLSEFGKYAIPVYLIHQPVGMAICMFIFRR